MHNTAMSSTAAESGALEINGSQPVWRTLNEARERAFTGEIVFEVEPEVCAYLDNGVVYYAVRAGEASLGERLLDAGLVDEAQLERGIVRVGDVEHLGRLFDREPTIDRDAVLVMTELLTQELITDLANREIATVRVCAYRHHPSGLHRWFAEPTDAAGVGDMANVGNTGRLSAIPAASDEAVDDELRIEWDEPLGMFDEGSQSVFADFDVGHLEPRVDIELVESVARRGPVRDHRPVEAPDVATLEREPGDVDEMDVEFLPEGGLVDVEPVPGPEDAYIEEVDPTDVAEDVTDTELAVADTDVVEVTPSEDEFQVVWPDGSATDVGESPVDVGSAGVEEPLDVVHEADGGFRFEVPPLSFATPDDVFGDDAEDAVPDDVADAVRRALAAIETATAESASVAPMDDVIAAEPVASEEDDTDTPVLEWDSSDDLWAEEPVDVAGAEPSSELPADTVPEPTAEVPADEPVVAPLSAFAPPTPDMAAEAIYRREAAAASGVAPAGASADAASVDVGDDIDDPGDDVDDADDGDGERTSALKRLIGSLRRKER